MAKSEKTELHYVEIRPDMTDEEVDDAARRFVEAVRNAKPSPHSPPEPPRDEVRD